MNRKLRQVAWLALSSAIACHGPTERLIHKPLMQAPRHHKEPVSTSHFGDTRIDDYQWMQKRDSKAVLDAIAAENALPRNAPSPQRGRRKLPCQVARLCLLASHPKK